MMKTVAGKFNLERSQRISAALELGMGNGD
jgi:hypothetical protein